MMGGEQKANVGSSDGCEGGAGGEWVGWMKKGGMGDSKRLFFLCPDQVEIIKNEVSRKEGMEVGR